MAIHTVLVVGAGIAGPALACLLARAGIWTTIVERATGVRSSGSPVDVRGAAVEVVERMNLLAPIRAAATGDSVGRSRRPRSRDRVDPTQTGARGFEVPRSGLATILYSAAREHVEYLFDDTVTVLQPYEVGVGVTFERAPARRFDLVVGAAPQVVTRPHGVDRRRRELRVFAR